jgi:chromosomal replication initiation ATPase DnaA
MHNFEVSRFSWGLSVGVEPPDIETRIEILLKKAENSGVDLPRNCALFIAQQVVANVRELEGALNSGGSTPTESPQEKRETKRGSNSVNSFG